MKCKSSANKIFCISQVTSNKGSSSPNLSCNCNQICKSECLKKKFYEERKNKSETSLESSSVKSQGSKNTNANKSQNSSNKIPGISVMTTRKALERKSLSSYT